MCMYLRAELQNTLNKNREKGKGETVKAMTIFGDINIPLPVTNQIIRK